MNPGDHQLFSATTPLVACPRCQNRLEYVVDSAAADEDVVLGRSCPGCGYHDSVVTSSLD